jgi:asparagine N-glycosylation enzyme membrane subunit Stt3
MTPPPPLPDDSIYDEMMKADYLRRARRFWIWMALVPAPLLVVLFFVLLLEFRLEEDFTAASWLILTLCGAWVIYCTMHIARTWEKFSTELKWVSGFWLALLFALLNAALFYGLLMAGCGVLMRVLR